MIKFLLKCKDFYGIDTSIPVSVSRGGQMQFADYDYDSAAAWAELSQEYSPCLGALRLWETDPIRFLLKYSPSSVEINVRTGVRFAKHSWTHAPISPPAVVLELLDLISAPPVALKTRSEVVYLFDAVQVVGHRQIVELGGGYSGRRARRAVELMTRAWVSAAETRGADYVPYLLAAAVYAQDAAGGAESEQDAMSKEVSWQIRQLVMAMEIFQKAPPWLSL